MNEYDFIDNMLIEQLKIDYTALEKRTTMNETDMTALLNCFDFDFPVTINQRYAILKKYIVNNDDCKTFEDFCKKVSPANDYIALAWCGMYIGIEKDGYAHS